MKMDTMSAQQGPKPVPPPPDPYEAQREAIFSAFPDLPRYNVYDLLGVGEGPEPELEAIHIAFQVVDDTTIFQLKELERSYQLTRHQAQGWYRSSLIAAGIGFVLFGTGVVLAMVGQVTTGLISMASGLIPEVVATLFFRQSKAADERVDSIQNRLAQELELQAAVSIANTIEDTQARDNLKVNIVLGLFYPSERDRLFRHSLFPTPTADTPKRSRRK